uniref:Uncharacterized protein LOC105131046 n=2 Tax=Rhizophora mucronata TaxID=61149 RepID=A0A2P2K3G3_RHIMU
MKHQTKRRKKKRPAGPPRASSPAAGDVAPRDGIGIEEEESKAVIALFDAFDSILLEEASSALKEANGDVEKAAEILANSADSAAEDPSSTCSVMSGVSSSDSGLGSSSSSWGSSSGSSEGFRESNLVNRKGLRGNNKQQKRVAVTGTVSTVLGKDYVKASPRRGSAKGKEPVNGVLSKEEAEEFLCSMLDDDCDLSMAVVRDVLCQYGYNVEKALDTLLDLSTSSHQQSRVNYDSDTVNCKQDARFLFENSDSLAAGSSKCTSYSLDGELHDSFWGHGYRSSSEALASTDTPFPTSLHCNESDLPQKLLESLFNFPKSSEHEPTTMNWKNVVKKMQPLWPSVNVCPSSVGGPLQSTCGS